MAYPCVSCDVNKLRENVERLSGWLHDHGAVFAAVTKGVCAAEPIVRMLQESSCDWIADSRVQNLAKIGGTKPKLLIRSAQPGEIEAVIRHADISFASEPAVLRLLAEEAARQGKRHGVLLALDMGDLREGCFFQNEEDMFRSAEAAVREKHLELLGVATNLGCFGGVRTTPENMAALTETAQKLRARLGLELPIVSGMSTAAQKLLRGGGMPKAVNHGRFGEAWLVGYDSVSGESVPGMHEDAFILSAQLIEVKQKPSKPVGEIGGDAFGRVIERPDRGPMLRGLLACGVQDIDRDCLEPLDERIEILGGSSDHTIVNLSRAPELRAGDVLRFRMRYGAVLRAYTSAYVEKEYI